MSQQTFATVEEAQAEIIRLQGQLAERTNERDALSQNNTSLTQELEQVRKLNQEYFLKLSAQILDMDENEPDPEPVLSCEDFARTIKL